MLERKRQIIMLVDDNPTNLRIGKDMLKEFYEVFAVSSAEKLFEILKVVVPNLILMDVAMPDMNGFEAVKNLKSNVRYAGIPVIFVTAKNTKMDELEGFDLGAVDYVTKPFSSAILMKRIENHLLIERQKVTIKKHTNSLMTLVQERNREVFKLQNAMLRTIADLVEFRDKFTGRHISHTQLYLNTLIHEMIAKDIYADTTINWNLDFILPSAQLHDVGKIAIPDNILSKPGELTTEEFEIMKTHVTIGIEVVKRMMRNTPDNTFLNHAMNLVGAHHEKWDGTGYPLGLKGEGIPLEGRLMAVADVYDALISQRSYRDAFNYEEAKNIIKEGKEKHFDPVLVDVFLDVEDEFERIAQL